MQHLVRQLFEPLPVNIETMPLPAAPPAVHREEALEMQGFVLKRQIEFATGRTCARRALAQLELQGSPLKNEAQRAPRRPKGIVGSLTHTGPSPGGLCAVAIGRAEHAKALDPEGVDASLPRCGISC